MAWVYRCYGCITYRDGAIRWKERAECIGEAQGLRLESWMDDSVALVVSSTHFLEPWASVHTKSDIPLED
jgi:hypothetical protein